MHLVEPQAPHQIRLIPNFCRLHAVLTLALAVELIALCFVLARSSGNTPSVQELLLMSAYLQWIGLWSAAVLCVLRRFLTIARPGVVFFVCWGMMAVIVMLSAKLALEAPGFLEQLHLAATSTFESMTVTGILGSMTANFDWLLQLRDWIGDMVLGGMEIEFVLRHTAIAAIVAFLLLRYFWGRHQWQEQVRAESEMRFQALNARIRPHFLFNALNSVVSLIAVRPAEAEELVQDLADVFRASLEKRSQLAPLAEEIAIVQAYLRIEKARLGDKLEVEWNVPEELLKWPVAMLLVQPLAENAVHHGVSKLKEGGRIIIRAWKEQGRLVVEVMNPIPPDDALKTHGNQVAVDNIASRIRLIYGERGRLELGPEGGWFRARLYLPENALQGVTI